VADVQKAFVNSKIAAFESQGESVSCQFTWVETPFNGF